MFIFQMSKRKLPQDTNLSITLCLGKNVTPWSESISQLKDS